MATSEPNEEIGGTVTRDPLIGAQLGEYRVLSRLGEGAMGVVYRGEQPLIGKPVAIKVLQKSLGADPAYVKKLLEEARAISAARHPNIIDIFSFGQAPTGQQYFVMECLEGDPLDLHLRQQGGTLPAEEVARLLQQILAGLSAAHAAGVVHRDLKPSNIFLARLGDGTRFVKLLDFGLAKRTAPNAGVRPTANLIVGTALYMAPEQALSEEVGPWTDLYAVGCIAHELLSGAPPFPSGNIMEVINAHASVPPRPLRFDDPTIPEAFETLVLELLEKLPARRPKSAGVARKTLERIERQLATHRTRASGLKQMIEPTPGPVTDQPAAVESEPIGPTRISQKALGESGEVGPTRISQPTMGVPPTKISQPALRDPRDTPTRVNAPRAGPVPNQRATRLSRTEPAQTGLHAPQSRAWMLVLLAPLLGVGGFFVAKKLDAPAQPVPSVAAPEVVSTPEAEPEPEPEPDPTQPASPPEAESARAPIAAPAKRPSVRKSRPTVKDLDQRIAGLRKRAQQLDTPLSRSAERELDYIWTELHEGKKSTDELSRDLDAVAAESLASP